MNLSKFDLSLESLIFETLWKTNAVVHLLL